MSLGKPLKNVLFDNTTASSSSTTLNDGFLPSNYNNDYIPTTTTNYNNNFNNNYIPANTNTQANIYNNNNLQFLSTPITNDLSNGLMNNFDNNNSLGSDFGDELPLLEELGINFPHILNNMLFVLMPLKTVSTGVVEDTDLAGPLLFCFTLGCALLMAGKLHFGYIYGYSVFGCFFTWLILNLLVPSGVAMYRVCSVVGYGLAPIVLLSLFNIILVLQSTFGFMLAIFCILWSAFSASKYFEKILDLAEQRWLIAYPLCLLYACFALITIF